MGSAVTVALLGTPIGKEIGKKGTQSDVTLYNRVKDGHALTAVEPTQFPEKIQPLLFALEMADRVVVTVDAISRDLAESLAAAEQFEKPTEFFLGAAVGEEDLKRALKGTNLAGAPLTPLDLPRLRESVDGWRSPERPGPVVVRVDHAFPVKGVGTVALGLVTQGRLEAHARLTLEPDGLDVEVRSIQVHDVDVPSADSGERVGLALKGVDADQVSRGQLLAATGTVRRVERFESVPLRRSRYYRGTLSTGHQGHALVGLQFVPVNVEEITADRATLVPDRPVAVVGEPGGYLADLTPGAGSRLVGRFGPRPT